MFLAEVQRLFFAVLKAWTALKPALGQGVMAPVIWEEQKAQIAAYKERGWRNVLDKLSFTSAVVAGALSDSGFDTVTVRINASSADYDLDASGDVIRGDTTPWDWTEDWIFQRPSTAQTGRPGTVTSQTCPNCGAAVNVDITSICPFCDAAVISGKFGWLLTRIDRVSSLPIAQTSGASRRTRTSRRTRMHSRPGAPRRRQTSRRPAPKTDIPALIGAPGEIREPCRGSRISKAELFPVAKRA